MIRSTSFHLNTQPVMLEMSCAHTSDLSTKWSGQQPQPRQFFKGICRQHILLYNVFYSRLRRVAFRAHGHHGHGLGDAQSPLCQHYCDSWKLHEEAASVVILARPGGGFVFVLKGRHAKKLKVEAATRGCWRRSIGQAPWRLCWDAARPTCYDKKLKGEADACRRKVSMGRCGWPR